MDLVDEQDRRGLQIGQDRRQVTGALEGRAGRASHARTHLVPQDVGDRGLSETRRAIDHDVVERLAARQGRLNEDPEVGLHLLLADVLFERARPQPEVDAAVVHLQERIEQALVGRDARHSGLGHGGWRPRPGGGQ